MGDSPEDNAELLRRLAASRIAHNAETWESFDLLSRPGLLRKGAVMLETADGLVSATLSVGQALDQRPPVLERLFNALEHPKTLPQLSAACRALAAAALSGWMTTESDRLVRYLTFEPDAFKITAHDRASLITAAIAAKPSPLRADAIATITDWARDRDDTLGERAALALVETGQFIRNAEWLAPKFGLSIRTDLAWDWKANAIGQFQSAPLAVIKLYSEQPDLFTPALCSILLDKRWFAPFDAVSALLTAVRNGHARLTQPVIESLFERVRSRQSSRQADPPVLRQAAILCPERFILQDWGSLWENWAVEARAALADALGGLPTEVLLGNPNLRLRAAGDLIQLAHDGQYAVRRAAHRSLGMICPEMLDSFCSSLADSPDPAKRSVAAEAWAWLPSFAYSQLSEENTAASASRFWIPDISSWDDQFARDCSKRVRDKAREAKEARRYREWARRYYLSLVVLTSPSDDLLLSSWKLAGALARTGDDVTMYSLLNHLESAHLAPSVRFRLGKAAKELKDRWEAITKEWPQPTIALPGGLRSTSASIHSEMGDWPVTCTLWHVSGSTQDADCIWGGLAVASSSSFSFPASESFRNEAVITLPNSREAEIWIHSMNSEGQIAFHGVAPYPIISADDPKVSP